MMLVKEKFNTRTLTKVSLLSCFAFIMMILDFPIGALFPVWLKFDFSDVPALIGSFAMGPVAGMIIELIKNLLKIAFKGTQTGGIGELANFIVGTSFVFTAGYIYSNKKTLKRAVMGMAAGTIAMVVIGALANYFVMLPLYDKFVPAWGLMEHRASIVKAAIIPFNILKGVIVSFVTIPLYKKISPILHK